MIVLLWGLWRGGVLLAEGVLIASGQAGGSHAYNHTEVPYR